jgi:EamA domain-containing membrane protein RarD
MVVTQPMNKHDQRDGTIYILLSSAGYSFFAIWVKNIQGTGLGALDIGLWRFLMAVPLFWLIVMLRRAPPMRSPHAPISFRSKGFVVIRHN